MREHTLASGYVHRSETHSSPFGVASLALLVALVGPALGYKGFYLSHIMVAFFFIGGLISVFGGTNTGFAPRVVLIAVSIVLYAGLETVLTGSRSGVTHIAMILASFGTLALGYGITRDTLSITEVRRVFIVFCAMLIAVCACELAFDWRLPVSRYSTFQTTNNGSEPIITDYRMPTGFYGNQNNLALVTLTMLPFSLLMRKGMTRLAVKVSLVALILLSDSRIAITCLAATFGLSWLLQRRRSSGVHVLLGTLAAVVALALVFKFAPELLCESGGSSKMCVLFDLTHEGVDLGVLANRGDSIGVRLSLTFQALSLLSDSPIFGIGPGTSIEQVSAVHFASGEITNLHNPALEILLEYGVVGALPWLVLWLMLLRSTATIRPPSMRSACMSTVLIFPIACVSVSTFYYFTALWAVVGMLAGVSGRLALATASDEVQIE